jgi:hypothetical protein
MAWRDSVAYWTRRSVPFLVFVILIGLAVAIIDFVPGRGGAALLGILAGAILSHGINTGTRLTVRVAVLWSAIAVAADAAFAKLNDQAPITLANALTRVVDAVIKLAEPLIRGLGIAAADPRAKVAAVAPDFVWALILSLIVFIALGFMARLRR